MEPIQWAVGIFIVIDIAITGFLSAQIWAHVIECKHVTARLAMVEADMNRAKEDIGTTDTGMRGQIHNTATTVTQHAMLFSQLKQTGYLPHE
jgi:hypothetical protein